MPAVDRPAAAGYRLSRLCLDEPVPARHRQRVAALSLPIGLLGICAGGGYAINAALIERRFKAVGTVVANDIGSAFRRMSPQAGAVENLLVQIGRGKGRRGDALLLGFDAFHLADELLVQPLQVIVGRKLGTTFSHEAGKALWERARNKQDFVVIDGADHYDMYDKPEYVDQAVAHLAALYDEHLPRVKR